MAEKCTNTSSPVERWIKPYPFAPLNHFTVPFSLTDKTPFTNHEDVLQFLRSRPGDSGTPLGEAGRIVSVASTMCRGNYFQKEKTPRLPNAASIRCGNSGVRQFGAFPPHPTNDNQPLKLNTREVSPVLSKRS